MSALVDAIAVEISEREERKTAIVDERQTLEQELATIDGQLEQLRSMAEQAHALNGASVTSPPAPGEQPDSVTTNGGRPERDGRKDGNAPDGRRPQSAGRQSGSASSGSSRNGSDASGGGGGTKRAAVLAYVAANGRCKVSEICQALGLSAGATRQHLKTLVDSGQLQAEGATSARVYFTTADGDREAATKGKTRELNVTVQVRQRVTDAIARDPGALTEARLAQALGLDRELVADACGQLLDADEISLGPDATYTISRGGVGEPVGLTDRIVSALQRCSSAWATSEVAYQAAKDGHGRIADSDAETALTELEADGLVARSAVMGGRTAWSVAR